MSKCVISKGPDQGPAGTIDVRFDNANWPIISGSGGPDSSGHMISPSLMEGQPGSGIPADWRLSSWPNDLVEALRVVHQASLPIDYLPTFFAVTIPEPGKLSVAHFNFEPGDYVGTLVAAYRAAGYEVTVA